MTLQVEDEIIDCKVIKEVEADQKFETATKEGKTASKLNVRGNTYQINIANIPAGKELQVTLHCVSLIASKSQTKHELVIPTALCPKYGKQILTLS
jgi:hypothetical protein